MTSAIFRDHKRQLDADFAAGTLSAAERDAAQADLATRLGQELAQDPAGVSAPSERSRWIAAMVLVACVPVIAGVLYFALGNPAAVNGAAAVSAEARTAAPRRRRSEDRGDDRARWPRR